jgi:4-amino-4-deoxy-L-arabinose transferase-like glycosyltransferase
MSRTSSSSSVWLILVWSLAIHLPGVLAPLRDYHAYRQTQTASMSRNYFRHGMHFLSPEVDTEGPPARTATEFPIYSYIVALFYQLFGVREIIGRLLSMLLAAWGALYLYRFVQPRLGETIARWSAMAMCVIPIHVYFTRTFQPEAMALWGLLGFLYYADLWLSSAPKTRYWLAALALGSIAPLLKLPYLYLLGPLWFLLAFEKGGWFGVLRPRWLFLLIGILAATYGWYHYAKSAPISLLPLTSQRHFENLRAVLSLNLWKDQFVSRFPELVFTYSGLLLAFCGLYNMRRAKTFAFLFAWLLFSMLYVVLLGRYGLIHKYTLLPVAPIAAVWMACGISMVWGHVHQKPIRSFFFFILLLGIPVHTGLRIRHWYNVEYGYLSSAKKTLDVSGDYTSLVLVATHEKPQHLYYLDRYGYGVVPELWTPAEVDALLAKGVKFILIPKFDNQKVMQQWVKYLPRKAALLEDHPDYLLYRSSARQG